MRVPADKRECGKGENCIDPFSLLVEHHLLDRHAKIEAAAESRDHTRSTRLQRSDHRIDRRPLLCHDLRARQKQPYHGGTGGAVPLQIIGAAVEQPGRARMVDPLGRIDDRSLVVSGKLPPQWRMCPVGKHQQHRAQVHRRHLDHRQITFQICAHVEHPAPRQKPQQLRGMDDQIL